MDKPAPPETATPPVQPRPRARNGTGINPAWVAAILPIAIALFSLILSVYTVLEANREPEIWLSAPDVVRVAAGESAWFYVQPRLVSAAPNDRVAVITGLRLMVTSPDAGEPTLFTWNEQGTWQYDSVNRGLTWIYLADPAPLVVSPSNPQLPICLFEGPPEWRWQTGTYQVRIVAGRGQDADALQSDFTITLPQDTIDRLDSQPRIWVEARTTPA